MPVDNKTLETLQEAMSRFHTVSQNLQEYYRLLKEEVQRLRRELEEKNKALKNSRRENDQLREQAERSSRLAAVGEMAVRMAHELRNPLGSIELFASLLKKHLQDDDRKRQWAEHISSGVTAMDYALSNLLNFTRTPKPCFRPTDLTKMIEAARWFAVHLIEQNDIRFTLTSASSRQAIRCDEDLIKQTFVNLILNAIDAMPRGGELRITVQPHTLKVSNPSQSGCGAARHGALIEISDTGAGIPEEALPKIFDPFFSTKPQGTGLGLSIAHHAVQAHGGSIKVQSKPGQGTRVTLFLPQNSDKSEAED